MVMIKQTLEIVTQVDCSVWLRDSVQPNLEFMRELCKYFGHKYRNQITITIDSDFPFDNYYTVQLHRKINGFGVAAGLPFASFYGDDDSSPNELLFRIYTLCSYQKPDPGDQVLEEILKDLDLDCCAIYLGIPPKPPKENLKEKLKRFFGIKS